MDTSNSSRVVLVTGGSRGIGYRLAKGFAATGATVAISARSEDSIAAARDQLTSELQEVAGAGRIVSVAMDVTNEDQVRAGVARIADEVGPVEVLINNAGINLRGPLVDMPLADWRAVMDTNVTGAFLVSREVAPAMIEAGRGWILNICSVQTARARATTAPYATSKAAIAGLTRAMCVEWAEAGIRVNGLAPGFIATDLNTALLADESFAGWVTGRTPERRWGELDDLVGPALWLCSEQASYVNGQIVYADGGMTAAL